MAKQNLKKRRVNHKAGPTQRRRNKAKQAQEQLNNLLNSMTPAQKAETLKQIAEDNDEATQKDVECADEETQKELGQMDR